MEYMPGGMFMVNIGRRYPKFAILFFGFFMSGLTYVWAYAIFRLHEIIAISLAITFLVVYLYLFYKLVYLKEKNKKNRMCKHCGGELNASGLCPKCIAKSDNVEIVEDDVEIVD
jgi:predicted membrane protein